MAAGLKKFGPARMPSSLVEHKAMERRKTIMLELFFDTDTTNFVH
jgi:hypothetical protein